MRHRISLLLLLAAACHSAPAAAPAPVVPELPPGQTIGEPIVAQQIVPFATVDQSPSDYYGRTVLVEATVQAVCQRKGCWMQVEDQGRTAMVRWESGCGGQYAFPDDAIGMRVVVQGSFYPKTIDPEDAEHLREESGGGLEVELEGYEFNASAVLVRS